MKQRKMWFVLGVCLLLAACGRQQAASPEPKGTEPMVNVKINKDTDEVKKMPLETYVAGVVAGEMGRLPTAGEKEDEGTDWPEEAYAAQAILARTFIIGWIGNHPNEPISPDVTEAQAYRPDNITPAIEKAVQRTRGEVVHHGGKPAQTFFHSYAGGHTATAKEGLNFQDAEPPYILSTSLPDNKYVPEQTKNWTAKIPLIEVQKSLAEAGVNVGAIEEVHVDKYGPSKRIEEVTVVGTDGQQTIHGAEFRLHVGLEQLKSTLIADGDLRVEGDHLVAKGRGFGHGVGLSQWDAYNMAKNGKGPEEIVQAFFKNVEIVKMWE